ncbi:DUF859 family phage minor structural protein [Streptococcus lutetiensis]|uniref:DUF859 family phage minor structural protein n=1 Tax=Streptococcus lutetiensis TaxID=150055 RepID=UPI001BD9FC04|nr:DUF859 family phage minor structural protein [Streptococcus lutetiensis]MBT0944420.1 DUF859 domain-containing protein [Streptococcus lutetiensis]MBT0949837.1 DUF859 domain-containing protein [Streptococcus lutetiensis]
MATATFSGQYGHNMTLEVWSDWNRQDIASNSSTVNVQARLRTNGYASMWGVTAPVTVTVNGKSESLNAAVNIGTNSSLLFYGKDFVVPHNGDGTKTVGIKISVGLNTGGYGSSMVAFDLPLPTIARASAVNDVTGTLGSAMTININRKNSAFKHTVKYNFGALSGTIATNVDTSVSWTPPLNLATAMPNKTSDWGNITVETYSGSSKIGSATCRLTLNVPDSVKPTLGSITLTDSNTAVKNLLNTANTFAEIVSDIKVAFNSATGVQGSKITGYYAEIVNKNQSTNANNGNLGLMKWNGSAQVKAWVVDSRGRSSNAVTTSITVLEYFLPTLTFTAIRGDTNQSSDKIVVSRTAKIAPLRIGNTQKNSFKLSFKTAPFGSTTYTADTGAGVNDKVTNTLTNSKATLSGTFDIGKSYEVYGVLEDALTSSGTVKAPPVSPEKMVMGMAETAVSFGKYPENANAVDSDWVFKYKNKDIQHHKLTNNNGQIIQVARNTDMNTIVETGFYCGEELLHRPTATGMQSHTYFRVQRFDTNATWVLQEAIDFNGVVSAYRVKKGGSWQDWQYYAVQNKVAEFTAVNQTKVYKTTIRGPYGLNANATRCGNIVNLSINLVYTKAHKVSGKAAETIPVGWRPTTAQIITLTGHAGGGTGTQNWTDSFADLHYETDGGINFTIITKAQPLGMMGSITWITTDPFPS